MYIVLVVVAAWISAYKLPDFLRWLRMRKIPMTTEWAELVKIQSNNWRPSGSMAAFRVDSAPKPLSFSCWGDFVVRLPSVGTRGKLVYKGTKLYSFTWDDNTLILWPLPEEDT